jgi:hypothetical protein
MRYLLKLKADDQYFELVDKWTFDNHKFALDDAGNPRYTNDHVQLNDDGTVSMNLVDAPARDLVILGRYLRATSPDATGGKGFVQEPETIKFRKGKVLIMRELATGEEWRKTLKDSPLQQAS